MGALNARNRFHSLYLYRPVFSGAFDAPPRRIIKRGVAWQLIGVFLNLCGSLAVRHDAAIGGYANENEMVARPRGKVLGVALTDDDGWVVSAAGPAFGICPDCGRRTRNRHGWSNRSLQDLPVQGKTVTVKLRLSRWRCTHQKCERQTFTDRLPTIASPYARRTRRVSEIVGLLGHSAGGRPGERLMRRLGMPVSDDTILRQLKRDAALVSCDAPDPGRRHR